MPAPALHELAERIGAIKVLDIPAKPLGKVVRKLVPAGPAKDALSGTWLGHALHPLLTDVPIGTWTSAGLLDLVGGQDAQGAADLLVGAGIAAALPAIVTGYTEWADSELGDPAVRRIGIVHAVSNVTALGLYVASLAARRRGARTRGKLLGLAGAGALGAGGFLGGHLSYARGVGVDATVFDATPEGWTEVARAGEPAEGEVRKVEVEGVAVALVRHGGELFALADRCTHRGGPLSDGELVEGCLQCPWHASRFALTDGGVVRGPAFSPQPAYGVREWNGVVEIGPPL